MKFWKAALTTTAIVATAAIAIKVYDKYYGHNVLGRKWGRVTEKQESDEGCVLLVKSFGRTFFVSVSKDKFEKTQIGDFCEVPVVCAYKRKDGIKVYHKSDAIDAALGEMCGLEADIQYL